MEERNIHSAELIGVLLGGLLIVGSSAALVRSFWDTLEEIPWIKLAIFVGFEVITNVPPTLHTPLMSGSNAISGITLVGAVTVTGVGTAISLAAFAGFIAILLATVNVVGGFLVTHRMLDMFKKK